jgi:hypothetical protein
MLSLKEEEASVKLRLHRIFLSADYYVLGEIADFIRNSTISTPLTRSYINQNTHLLKRRADCNIKHRHQGRFYNLIDFFSSLNREYFMVRVNASITWGPRRPGHRAKRRTLGTYCFDRNTIRINPVLDSRSYPRYYLDYIVYHEMLHADIGFDTASGRNSYHSRKFRERERLFKHYERVLKFEERD